MDHITNNFHGKGVTLDFQLVNHCMIKTKQYIANQEEYHKKITFKEELVIFLKEYGIEYDERYLWTD